MTETRCCVPLGVPTLVGFSGFAGMVGLGGQPWQLAVSGVFTAVLVSTDIVRGWGDARAAARELT